jgi:general secretion pathway protein I
MTKPRVRTLGSGGFTLIEVLAALVIVALGMLGAIEAVSQSVRNGAYLREKTLAHWIAMNVITERRLQASPPDVAETNGGVEFAGAHWRWTMKVTQTAVKSLRRMDVAVRADGAPEGSALATVSGFYGEAVGAAGGGSLSWAGTGAPGSGGDQQGEGADGEESSPNNAPANPPQTPPANPPPANPTDSEE